MSEEMVRYILQALYEFLKALFEKHKDEPIFPSENAPEE